MFAKRETQNAKRWGERLVDKSIGANSTTNCLFLRLGILLWGAGRSTENGIRQSSSVLAFPVPRLAFCLSPLAFFRMQLFHGIVPVAFGDVAGNASGFVNSVVDECLLALRGFFKYEANHLLGVAGVADAQAQA